MKGDLFDLRPDGSVVEPQRGGEREGWTEVIPGWSNTWTRPCQACGLVFTVDGRAAFPPWRLRHCQFHRLPRGKGNAAADTRSTFVRQLALQRKK